MWKPGEITAWRGIYDQRIWHVQTTIVVKDSPDEIVLTLLPGAECIAEETYPNGKKNGNRRWDFKDSHWNLEKYTWQTNRLLLIFEPEKFSPHLRLRKLDIFQILRRQLIGAVLYLGS